MTERCIYCGTEFQRRSGQQGDHVIPDALGAFHGALKFHRICRTCNSQIGACEEELVRCGPESFLRHYYATSSRRREKRKSSFTAASRKSRPPQLTALLGGHQQPVHLDTASGKTVPVDCLVVQSQDDPPICVRLSPEMSVESLRNALRRAGIRPGTQARVHFDSEHRSAYESLFREIGWLITESGEDEEEGERRVPTRAHCRISDDYFRAVAKIAFHYFLVASPRGYRGDEQEFSQIREFILSGGAVDQFYLPQPTRFAFPPNAAPSILSHFLLASEADGVIEAVVNLYWGPKTPRPARTVRLAHFKRRRQLRPWASAHRYVLERAMGAERGGGYVEEVLLSRLR